MRVDTGAGGLHLERRAHRLRIMEQTEAAVLAIHAVHTTVDDLITVLLTHLCTLHRATGVGIWATENGVAQPVRLVDWPEGLDPLGQLVVPGENHGYTVLTAPLPYHRFGQDAFLASALPAFKSTSLAKQRALESLAKHAATALEHLDLDMACMQRASKLELLHHVGQQFTSNLSPEALYSSIYQEVRKVMVADVFFVALYDDSSQEVELAYVFENGHQLPPLKFALNDGPTSRVIATNSPLLFNIDAFPLHTLTRFGNTSRRTQSLMMVPIALRGRVLGAISVQSFTRNAHNEDDLNVLSAIASQAAIAIENAHLFAEARRMASTDALTGLLNRRSFVAKLDAEIAAAQAEERSLALVMIDSDSLKQINEQFGYHAGDEHLCNLAKIIQFSVRQEDTVSRYGGDEFMLLLPDATSEEATTIANRIILQVHRTIHTFSGGTVNVTISAGVAEYPRHAKNRADLLLATDRATNCAKRMGKNRAHIASGPATAGV